MRRRATAVNTVASTSRTACGSGCTCCLTQVFSNSHALSASAHWRPPYSGCGLSVAPVHPPLFHPNPHRSSSSSRRRSQRLDRTLFSTPRSSALSSPFRSFLFSFFFSFFERENGGSPALPLLSDDIMSCRQAWVFCQRFPKRVWWLARRCVSRNTLYPNADLIRPDCSPSYFIQNRERGWGGRRGGGGCRDTEEGSETKNETKKNKKQQHTHTQSSVWIYVRDKAESPVLSACSLRIVQEWHAVDRWERICSFKLHLSLPGFFLFPPPRSGSALNTHIVLHHSQTFTACFDFQFAPTSITAAPLTAFEFFA